MCGIVGYTGGGAALPHLLAGLAALEYRGYDSVGVALVDGDGLSITKRAGRLAQLDPLLAGRSWPATTGIGHTRWATHGAPDDRNAHPHADADGAVALVHNGIIENHLELRSALQARGHRFRSDTDSEVLVHLLADELQAEPEVTAEAAAAALSRALRRVQGAFALAVVLRQLPQVVLAARRGAPLLLGRSAEGTLLASDVSGLDGLTSDVEALEDDQVAVLTPGGAVVRTLDGQPASGRRFTVDWSTSRVDRGRYAHFMLKEIHEQPAAVRATLADRIGTDGQLRLDQDPPLAVSAAVRRVTIVACGTSAHAGMAAQHAIEQLAGVPVTVELASEFRYRDPLVGPDTLVVAISQSGETADTIGAAEHARGRGAPVVALTNTQGSSLTRVADAVLCTRAGVEVGVAATKTFSAQLAALQLLGMWLAQARRTISPHRLRLELQRLTDVGTVISQSLHELDMEVADLARELVEARYLMVIGRGVDVAIALEGALKLKEVSYVTAEGYAAGEMKHGPIALIEPGVPVIALATAPATRAKLVANMAEVRARGARIIAVAHEDDVDIKEHADRVLFVPATSPLWSGLVTVLPLQLLSYHLAVALGRDVDKPRNLAKTVTVE